MNKATSALFLITGLACLALPARAITIDFETGSGYSATGGTFSDGSLGGQPSTSGATKWTGGGSGNETYIIGADTIDGSGQWLQSAANNNSPFYSFTGSSTDLGGTFSNTSSLLSFNLQYAMDAAPSAGATTALGRISFGQSGTPSLQIEVLSNGGIDFTDGATNYFVTKAVGNAATSYSSSTSFTAAANTWATISGTVNYATQTFTLTVNGIQQTDATSGSNFSFRNLSVSGQTDAFNLRELNGGSTSSYVQTSFDNVTLTLAPEPTSTALLGLGLLLGLGSVIYLKKRLAPKA